MTSKQVVRITPEHLRALRDIANREMRRPTDVLDEVLTLGLALLAEGKRVAPKNGTRPLPVAPVRPVRETPREDRPGTYVRRNVPTGLLRKSIAAGAPFVHDAGEDYEF